jgi:hypothetical protein
MNTCILHSLDQIQALLLLPLALKPSITQTKYGSRFLFMYKNQNLCYIVWTVASRLF